MKTFNLQILLVLLFVGVGELWGQPPANCNAGVTWTIRRVSDNFQVADNTGGTTVDICPNIQYQITLANLNTNANSYVWSSSVPANSTITGSPGSTVTVTVSSNLVITVDISDNVAPNNECSSSSIAFTFNTLPTPSLSITPSSAIVCSGQNITLTAAPAVSCSATNPTDACNGLTYVWSTGVTTSTNTYSGLTANTPYTVTATNFSGCKASITSTVTVNAIPTITSLTLDKANYCNNDIPVLTANGVNAGSGTLSGNPYSWSVSIGGGAHSSLPGSPSSGNSITAPAVVSSTSYIYRVTVSNSNNCSVTASTSSFTPNPVPTLSGQISVNGGSGVSVTSNTATINVCEKSTVALTVNPGGGAHTYAWAQNGGSFGSGLASENVIPNGANITGATVRSYNVTVTNNASSCSSEFIFSMNVYDTVELTNTNTYTICDGQTQAITLTTSASPGWGTSTLSWSPVCPTCISGTPSGQIYTTPSLSATTIYTVTVTRAGSGNSCISVLPIAVNVTSNPVAAISVGGVTATNFDICEGEILNMTASGGTTFNWTTMHPGYSGPTSSPNIMTVPPSNFNYEVVVGQSGCTSTATLNVVVKSKPLVTITGGQKCENISFTLNPTITTSSGSTIVSYNWNNGAGIGPTFTATAPSSGSPFVTYTLGVTDDNGCTATGTTSIEAIVCGPIFVDVTGNGGYGTFSGINYACSGQVLELNITGSTFANSVYSWETGETNQSIYVPLGEDSCEYTIVMRDCFGDGWNGGYLTIKVDGSAIGSYSVPSPDTSSTMSIKVGKNSFFSVDYTPGAWEAENSYEILLNGTKVFEDGTYTPPFSNACYAYTQTSPNTGIDVFRNACNATSLNNFSVIWESGHYQEEILSWGYFGCFFDFSNGSFDCGYYTFEFPIFVYVVDKIDTLDIVVSNPDIMIVPGDSTLCHAASFIAQAQCPNCLVPISSSSYVWNTNPTGQSSFNVNNLTSPLTLIVEAVDDVSCPTKDTVYYTPRADITASINPPNPSYCPNGTVSLFASATQCLGCSYTWTTGQISPSITINQTGAYSVTVTNEGCTDLATVTVTQLTPFKPIIVDASNNTINSLYLCNGEPDSLFVDINACIGCSYTWNGGATTPFTIINSQGGIFVEVIDENGCTGYSDPVLAINNNFNAIAIAMPNQICPGSNAVLNVNGCPGCTYSWFENSSPNNIIASTRISTITATGDYFAVVENPVTGCRFTSNLVTISNVTVTDPIIVSNTTTICDGSIATLTTNRQNGVSYQWYGGSGSSTIISYATDTFLNVYPQNSNGVVGVFSLIATYPNGCTASSSSITITETDFTPVITLTSSNANICPNQDVTLSSTNGIGWNYQWYRNGVIIPGEISYILNVSQTGTYYAIVTNSNLCTSTTNSIFVNESPVNSVTVFADRTEICPGESARLGVTLCPQCSYEWFNGITGISITGPPDPTNYTYLAQTSGIFFAEASALGCTVRSDSITIILKQVIIPAINTSSQFVCEGQNATLVTSGCNLCDYSWIRNGQPIFGALNDTLFIVSNPTDAGAYQVLVSYPNGCSDTSSIVNINDGSYSLSISINPLLGDSVVCNNSNVVVESTSTSIFCALGCSYQWFRNGGAVVPSNVPSLSTSNGGFYRMRMSDSRGCIEESNLLQVTQIDLIPSISSTSTAICGNDAIRLSYPDSASCLGCVYEWQKGGSAAVFGTNTNPFYLTDAGANAVGVYSLEVTQSGCTALSNLISLNQISGLSIPVASTDQNICNGDTTTIYRVGGGCVDCQFQWLLDSLPILAATTPSLTVSNPGNYNLQMSVGATGCRDTSSVITLLPVQSPIDSLNLEAVFYSPLTNTGPSLNLQTAVFPSTTALASVNDTFYSQPFNAAFAANSGLSGPRNDTLNPGDAGPGFHRIYYQFDTLGCSFVYDDILLVFGEPSVSITNENNNAPQFEACVADTIVLTVFNMPFEIDRVYLFNENNTYFSVPVDTIDLTASIYGGATVYNGTIRLGIPDNAYSSFMLVTSAGNVDSFVTPFLLIHNTNLDISGLPGVVCSANPPLALTGTPAGGFFTAQYFSGGTLAQGTTVTGAFTGNNFNTGAMTRASYGNDMLQNVRVVYNYFNSFTNGIGCPQVDTISQFVEARGVFLDEVKFNPISVSQDRELLSNLVFRVTPYQSQPSWIRQNYNNGAISFSGNFTFPAGNPVDFLPKNAGVGRHAMTYRISNGSCTNEITDSIQVIPAPSPIGIPDSMCRNQTFADFYRHTLYNQRDSSYNIALGINYRDTTNIISVYTTNGPNAGLTVFPSSLNLERYNYNPAPVPANTDTLKMEYWYKKIERINGVPVDTIMYIVGSIVTPIFIENPFNVEIIDTIVNSQYCEEDELYLLAGSCPNPPCRGIFTLQGGTGAYASGAILLNNILNPYDVHSPENSTTVYNLTYTVTGAVCQNSDTKQITIPEPIDPAFSTVSGKRIFCKSDPTENIIISATGNFSEQWLINGIFQQTYTFSPLVLNAGNQVVTNIITDNQYGCVYTAVDTYLVNPLPVLSVNPLLDAEYCTNDSIVNLVVTPDPVCPVFVPQSLLFEGFESLTFPWNRESTGAGNPWIRSTSLPFSGVSSALVTTSNDVQNAWMFSPNINMVTGQSYRITVFASAGNCTTPGCLPAALRVRLSQGQSILTHSTPTTVLVADTTISQTFYQPYSFNYTHSGLSGNYNFSMHCYSGIGARSLFVDNITIANTSVQTCASGGLGIMNGPGVAFAGNSTYTFNPQIVAPGNHIISYVYTDAATGCTNSIPMPVLVKQHVIPTFTNLNPQYCDNASPVQLIGTPPNGTFSSSGPNLVGSAYDPSVGFQNEIVSYNYLDLQTGCRTIVSDTVTVVSITDSARIIGINASGYCYNVDSILLNISSVFGNPDTVLAGDFYGFGVRKGLQGPGIATFYPDSAVLDAGRYGDFVITYIYPTLSGCFDTTKVTTSVHAMPDLSFDFMVPVNNRLPDSICLNAGTDSILVNNHVITGNLGQIVIDSLLPVGLFLGGTYTPSLGAQDTLNPLNFGVGWHNISFSYTDANGCSAVISDSFRVDTVPNIYFTGLQADRIYCENEVPSLLLAYPPYYPGSGYLQLTSGLDSIIVDSSFYLINPAELADTTNLNVPRRWDIYYTFQDLNFCSNSATDTFLVWPYPRISMHLDTSLCSGPTFISLMDSVSPQGGIFTDNLVISDIVQDSLLYLGGSVGPRQINYYYTDSLSTCRNNAAQNVTIYSTPDFNFFALGGCVGATITFVSDTNNLDVNVDSITRIEWLFGDGNSFVNNTPPDSLVQNQTYVYSNDSAYQVSLIVTNQGICTDTVTRQLVISPFVNTYPYVETFQSGTGDWYQEEPIIVPDTNAVWQRAELIGNVINDPGNFAWVTKPEAPYSYNANERAWVYSPCFDFTSLNRPMIAMDIWRDFLTDIDGAVLEYYDDYSNTWKPLGETERGINWYQTNFLLSRPGNQAAEANPRGWTGESEGWEKARYRLDNLYGRPYLRFRVAFASDPNTVLEGHEGFAFDSVWIGDRGRNVLVEHFSNFYHFNQQGASMDIIDKKVYDTIYNSTNGRDVSLIQYQTNIQQVDPVNALFNFDFDSRVLYYGINANSQIRIDGLTYGNGKSENLSQLQMDFDMLQFPVFDIRVDPLIFSGNTIQVNAEARALTNLDSADYTMTFAITEDDIFNNRGFAMKSVLRKFIPDASGFSLQQGFSAGQIINRSGSWIYNFGTPDPSKIEAVVYIQNNNTKDVMQVATTRDLSIFPPVGAIPTEEEAAVRRDIIGMNLFPNPAQNYFNVSFDLPLSDDYQWALVDVLGRVLDNGIARENTEQMIVDTEKLSEGTYFFTIRNDHAYAQRKVVISKK